VQLGLFSLNWSAQLSSRAFVRDALIPSLIYVATNNGQFCRRAAAWQFLAPAVFFTLRARAAQNHNDWVGL
jgi:hypothetical protein